MAKKTNDRGKDDLSKLSFEEAIRALSQIVEKIESGQVPLQESLEQYEKGMRLITHCRRILQEAEKRIAQIEEVREAPKLEEEKTEESADDLEKTEEDFGEEEEEEEDGGEDWLKG
jgi:exodeoxyribonuclease VII small subunit